MSGTQRSTGNFRLAEIPTAPPIENLSVRLNITAGGTTTVGFVVAGAMPRQVLVRAIGPGLAHFGVSSALANPSLTVYSGARAIATNDDWNTAAAASRSGSGTGSVSGTATGSGTTSGNSGSGMGGTATGTGSGTTGTGVNNVTSALATSSMFAQVGAFGLQNGSRDAATMLMLAPGAYTVQVSSSTASTATIGTGSGGTGTSTGIVPGLGGTGSSGDVLVEIYFVE
jgi:hypothetical protein